MSDAVTLARTARESLARGLSALQSDPQIPPQLQDLAASIAQAMAALHSIERSGGTQIQPAAQTALTNVQGALAKLQSQPMNIPAVSNAMDAVAGALSSVHALTRAAPPQPQAAPAPAPAPAPYPPQAAAPAPQPQNLAFAPTALGQAPPAMAAAQGRPGFANAPTAAAPAQAAPGRPGGPVVVIQAELGAHSPTNFYKGLSGNDVVDHGGIFVSTYKLPKLGETVRLKVSMPGGYEFEANGIVRWRREPSDSAGDAPPGFGAQLADITAEARQLVYRYVRNREPIFHDDL